MTAGGADTTTRGAGTPILTFTSACADDAVAIAAIISTSAVFFMEISFHLFKQYTTLSKFGADLYLFSHMQPMRAKVRPVERFCHSDIHLLPWCKYLIWGCNDVLRIAVSKLLTRNCEERHCRKQIDNAIHNHHLNRRDCPCGFLFV
jgi:hypothetical protein